MGKSLLRVNPHITTYIKSILVGVKGGPRRKKKMRAQFFFDSDQPRPVSNPLIFFSKFCS